MIGAISKPCLNFGADRCHACGGPAHGRVQELHFCKPCISAWCGLSMKSLAYPQAMVGLDGGLRMPLWRPDQEAR